MLYFNLCRDGENGQTGEIAQVPSRGGGTCFSSGWKFHSSYEGSTISQPSQSCRLVGVSLSGVERCHCPRGDHSNVEIPSPIEAHHQFLHHKEPVMPLLLPLAPGKDEAHLPDFLEIWLKWMKNVDTL